MPYSVDIIKVGALHDVPSAEVYWMAKFDSWEPLNIYAAVVRGGGHTLVVNTGFADDPSEIAQFWQAWDKRVNLHRTENEKIAKGLKRLGVDPKKVDHLVFTPMTAYTTGKLDLFPNATIHILRRGWIDFMAPDPKVPQLPRYITMPTDQLVYLLTKAWDRIRFLDDEDQILPGVRTFFAGTHHRSSLGILIDTAKGVVCLSDCMFKYPNLENNHPIGIAESTEEAYHSYARIRAEAAIPIPLYDPEVLKRHKGGKVA